MNQISSIFFTVVHCQWSEWSKVGSCSKTCGKGIQNYRRTKLAFTANGNDCLGKETGKKYCNTQSCPTISSSSSYSSQEYNGNYNQGSNYDDYGGGLLGGDGLLGLGFLGL